MATGQLLDVGVKDLRTVDEPPQEQGLVLMIERLAANKDVDVAKLEKVIELQERILRYNAEAAFNAAFATMQADIPAIVERGKTDKGKYAELEDIVTPVRPILARHGFSLSHQTEWPDKATVRVIGILTHRDGHARKSEFLSGADQTGSKNAVQALGSTVSYGRRYTTKDLLCIVTKGEDDDARTSDKGQQPEAPKGFDDWVTDMGAVADQGFPAFSEAWKKSRQEFRDYASKYHSAAFKAIKAKAVKVKAS